MSGGATDAPAEAAGRAGLRRALFAGLLVCLPTLGAGFLLDDYLHLYVLNGGEGYATQIGDLYRFVDGDPDHLQRMMNLGPHPWWAHPEIRVAFMRPLASWLAALDHRLFGAEALGYHLHSVAWYLALVAAVALPLRRALTPAVAAWALLLFAIDDAHVQAVAWIANRNALLAAAPAFLGLAAHLRWREEGWRWGLPLSLLGLSAGLFGGEVAVGVAGYWLAYELFAAPGSWRRRALSLAPVSAMILAYLWLHGALGYGAEHSGTYLDPRAQPLDWLAAAPKHALTLIGGQVFGTPTELWYFAPGARGGLMLAGALGAALMLWLLRWAWPDLNPKTQRGLRWLGPGALISLIPAVSVFPMGRMLLVPSVGGFAVLAAVLVRFGVKREGEMRRGPRLACGALVGLHLVLAPLGWLAVGLGSRAMSQEYERIALGAELDDALVAQQRVFIPLAPDPVVAYYAMVTRSVLGRPMPKSAQLFSVAPYAHRLHRVAPDAFELEVVDGQQLTTPLEAMFRPPSEPLARGQVVALEGVEVEVLELGSEGPTRLRITLDRPLESPELVFLAWDGEGLARLELPPVGESVLLERAETPFAQL